MLDQRDMEGGSRQSAFLEAETLMRSDQMFAVYYFVRKFDLIISSRDEWKEGIVSSLMEQGNLYGTN